MAPLVAATLAGGGTLREDGLLLCTEERAGRPRVCGLRPRIALPPGEKAGSSTPSSKPRALTALRDGPGRRRRDGSACRTGSAPSHALLWLLSGLACCVFSCANAGQKELRSANPLDRARATVQVAEKGSLQAAHRLVDLLADEDPAVRMYAIVALRRMYGKDYGYQYYAAPAARAAAIERWRDALRSGQLNQQTLTDVMASPGEATSASGANSPAPAPPPSE